MSEFQRAYKVSNMSVVYYRFHANHPVYGIGLYELQGTTYMCPDNHYAVWDTDTVELAFLTTEEFNERFVMEENLPARLKHLAEGALSYDEWVDAMDAKARDKSMETV